MIRCHFQAPQKTLIANEGAASKNTISEANINAQWLSSQNSLSAAASSEGGLLIEENRFTADYSMYGRPTLLQPSMSPAPPSEQQLRSFEIESIMNNRAEASHVGQHPAADLRHREVGSQRGNNSSARKIPLFIDIESGSSSQATKRRKNREACKKHRDLKRNEVKLEQKITSQQIDLQKQSEKIQAQANEIAGLINEREYYRSERAFYRGKIGDMRL